MSCVEAISELETRLGGSTLEDVASRHRRERKELQAKLQAMKKNAPKNNKNKRKEFLEEMARLEGELEKRHQAELQEAVAPAATTLQAAIEPPAADSHNNNNNDNNDNDEEVDAVHPTQQRVSKAQKRRDKKEREAREREQEIRVELQNAANEPSPKLIELQQITAKLSSRQLALHSIASDGDCLYHAVRHQLQLHGLPDRSVAELRHETAQYVRAHKDELICYMTHPETGEVLNDEQFEAYCEDIAKTHSWGGHIELKALSSLLRVPIEVIQAVGASTLLSLEELGGAPLIICYHRHIYQLGAHYNSTVSVE
ncbi:deubiquitinase OTUD6B [Drosophila grimshawi]|uniref:ubiquitinyl hydrolase 1 n=1 Tax=Drosophila grimshawi TaxID=7222 RepID=B4IZ10_DROGR|nr:deubiquitinase OTUD6B [Drosophila grimshawi]EDV97718.1 GH17023 [Drosophila grimshawi]